MKRVLPVIVISQFFCTSLWFAGNAIIGDIVRVLDVKPEYLAHLTSAVQSGFIAGTFIFAILSIADRLSPSLVFFASSIIAAAFNLVIAIDGINAVEMIALRFLTGFFLAGIYPVGMKIASDHYGPALGKSLGFLVGALVLGTAFPHLLKSITVTLPWKYVIYTTSVLSLLGGLAIFLFVPDGPHRKQGNKVVLSAFLKGFKNKNFRAAAFGYFGHMWELYTFWMFVPVILAAYQYHFPAAQFNIPLLSFLVIASGSISCIIAGLVSQHFGSKKIATVALGISCACCLVSPLVLLNAPPAVFIAFLFAWSMAAIADSPMFSTLVAQNAPADSRGASLTIINCIGFSITVASIQFVNAIKNGENAGYIYMLLALGPILGLIALARNKTTVA